MANDLEAVHRGTRTVLTFYEQFADPAAGRLTVKGWMIANRLGSGSYGFYGRQRRFVCHRVGDGRGHPPARRMLANEITGSSISSCSWIGRSHVAHGR